MIRVHFIQINDYYEGEKAQLWIGKEMAWEGYSSNQLLPILEALGLPYQITGKALDSYQMNRPT